MCRWDLRGDVSSPPSKNSPIIKRVAHALYKTGRMDIWNDIINCNDQHRCHSIYCEKCSKIYKYHSLKRMKNILLIKYDNNETEFRKQVRHLTVLTHLIKLDLSAVDHAIQETKNHLINLKRKFKGIVLEGRFELEVIDVRRLLDANECPRKSEVINNFIEKQDGEFECDMILVHFHTLIDLSGHSENNVIDWMENIWHGNHCVHMKSLWDNKDIIKSINDISKYGFKMSHCYNMKINGNKKNSDLYMSNEGLSFRVMSDKKIGNNRMSITTNRWMK
jgi:hypothetical protein